MSLAWRRVLAGLSGLLLWLSFPNSFALHFEAWTAATAWIALLPLLGSLWGQAPAQGFRLGLLTGFVFFLLSLTWITNVRPMGVASYPAWIALSLWCALFVGAWAAAAAWAGQRKAALPAVGLAALWALLELLRERLFSGFSWVNLGSSQAVNPAILPLAAITGQVGLHFAVALGNLCFFSLCIRPELLLGFKRSASALAVIALLAWGVHLGREAAQAQAAAPGARVKVGVIQGAIDQDQVWTAAYKDRVMSTYLLLSHAAIKDGAKALLWPEGVFPGFFSPDAPEAKALAALAKAEGVHLLVGAIVEERDRYRNVAVWIAPDGSVRIQDKRHLVPFGEYVPFRSAIPILDAAMAQLGVTNYVPGVDGPRFDLAGLKTQPIICYESVFPATAREGPQPDLLGVITVDTWYGESAGPVWHASQCALRAVENGCWVARSAATGISLFADPQGRLLQPIALDQAGYRVAEIGPGQTTFYRSHGEWLAGLLLLFLSLAWGPLAFRKSSD